MDNKIDIIKDIFFNEIINEAKIGEVKVEKNTFDVGFNACVEGNLTSGNFGDSKPILMINNPEQLTNLLCEYVEECDKYNNSFSKYDLKTRIKGYLTLVWNNAIYEDFANPLYFLKKQIGFYQNKVLEFKNNKLGNYKISSYIQDVTKEAPYVFTIKSKENKNICNISYGIYNDECYIYAIENEEDFSNVLTLFFEILNHKGIEKIKVVSLLPIRYNSQTANFEKKYESKLKKNNLSDSELKKLLLEYKIENLKNQQKLSEELINKFRTLEYNLSNLIITSFPMEFDEYMHVIVKNFKNNFLDSMILQESYNISK